jgi:hypothetical protein
MRITGPMVGSRCRPMCWVCEAHHHYVHERGGRVEADGHGGFRFFRPDGREVLPAPALPAVHPDPVKVITQAWLPPGATVGPGTGLPTWQGERPDYEWMGWCLGSLESRQERGR